MGYVEKNLMPNEKIMLKANLHWGVFISPVLVFIVLLILSCLLLLPGLSSQSNLSNQPAVASAAGAASISLCCGVPLFLIGVLYLAWVAASYFTTEFAVTDQRIIAKTGLLRQHSLELMLGKVESIGVNQPLMGRILDYGSIVVVGTGGTKELFPFIANPMELRQKINTQIATMTSR